MRKGLVFLILIFSFHGLSHGELSVDVNRHGEAKLHFQTKGGLVWTKFRRIPDNRVLNLFGDRLGDQAPCFGINPASGMPMAVWALNEGDYEIVYSRFDQGSWIQPIKIENEPLDFFNDVLPSIDFDALGNLFIVWQKEMGFSGQIYVSGIAPGTGEIVHPKRVSDDFYYDATSPFLKVVGEETFVAYEERDPFGFDFIIIVKIDFKRDEEGIIIGNGGESEGCIGRVGTIIRNHSNDNGDGTPSGTGSQSGGSLRAPSTLYPSQHNRMLRHPLGDEVRAEVELHYNGCALWADWINTKSEMGYSVYENEEFGEANYVRIRDLVDVPSAREKIGKIIEREYCGFQDEDEDQDEDPD